MNISDILKLFQKKPQGTKKPQAKNCPSSKQAADEALNEIFRKHRKN